MLYHNENDPVVFKKYLLTYTNMFLLTSETKKKFTHPKVLLLISFLWNKVLMHLLEVLNGFTAEERLDGMNIGDCGLACGEQISQRLFILAKFFLIFIIQVLPFTVAMHLQFLNVLTKALCHTNS